MHWERKLVGKEQAKRWRPHLTLSDSFHLQDCVSFAPSMGALSAFASHIKKHYDAGNAAQLASLPDVNRAFGSPLFLQCMMLRQNSVAYSCDPSTQDAERKSNTSRSSSVV